MLYFCFILELMMIHKVYAGLTGKKLQKKFVWSEIITQSLSAGLYEFFGRFWLVVCYLKAYHHWKNASTMMICLGKKQLGSTSPWIVPRLVSPMKHLHTCSVFSQAANKQKFSCRSFKTTCSNHGKMTPALKDKFSKICCYAPLPG